MSWMTSSPSFSSFSFSCGVIGMRPCLDGGVVGLDIDHGGEKGAQLYGLGELCNENVAPGVEGVMKVAQTRAVIPSEAEGPRRDHEQRAS
jgi:hypothetical protein